MKASSLALLAFAAAALAAGCGRVVTVDDSNERSPFDDVDSGPDSSREGIEGGPTMEEDADTGPPGETPLEAGAPPDPGTCADYTPGFDAVDGGGHVGAGPGTECTIAVDVRNGSIVTKHGSSGVATLTGDVYRLSCDNGASVLMAAVIRCFKGPGSYDVPAGALVLGGHVSDRKCRLDADTTAGQLRGFISCDSEPADPSNVFANSGPPIGLGDYALPSN